VSLLDEAARRLELTLGLSPERARRAVEEVLDAMRFDVDAYIEARHAQLQAENVTNAEIYQRIADELQQLRFVGPKLSARQIRRRIYG
jgi:pyruvate-formate lyase-activating enzyme